MNTKKYLLSLSIAISSLCVNHTIASAAYLNSSYTKADLNKDIANKTFIEEFRASSFIGDDGDVSYELEIKNIIQPRNQPISSKTEQFNWKNGEKIDFSLSFDGKNLTYTVGGVTLQKFNVLESDLDINGMVLSATSTSTSAVDLALTNIQIEGDVEYSDLFGKNGDTNLLKITGIDQTFTLTGTQIFSWQGQRPVNFDLAYDIRVGTFSDPIAQAITDDVEIPEPTSISFFSLTVLGIAASRRRSKNS
ncbi:protein of unknown function DUF1555 [Stanieria cyanosphaera PCC 7437]|uniref:PEP motif anchor domain protein n=1 Tax=Stanieria cyanosphaera (strain ATCC 29371 / PCC 7437) TaxID=111780 RepID=K9XXI3_STAC7|nr:choice-of-anchor W domain-containing protein [Stanieria cyanosphaera]AFZ36769.1 protein of unknown function DUF1555 [Stanieria cyanosphaera PCC 7437]